MNVLKKEHDRVSQRAIGRPETVAPGVDNTRRTLLRSTATDVRQPKPREHEARTSPIASGMW